MSDARLDCGNAVTEHPAERLTFEVELSLDCAGTPLPDQCTFCAIAQGYEPASIVAENDLVMAIIDLRQFHPGHTLVIPRHHFRDVRELDGTTGAALMSMVSRVTRAVGLAFPNQGLSLWHSIGEAVFQEVPHLHVHIHPRLVGDNMLKGYPFFPANAERATLDAYAATLRSHLPQSAI
jgi:histidine triad (HIT) family protein